MGRKILILSAILVVVELLLFFAMIYFSMTDEKVKPIAGQIEYLLKYVFGFPMVIINQKLPFFLESKNFTIWAIICPLLNNIILSTIVLSVSRFIKSNF